MFSQKKKIDIKLIILAGGSSSRFAPLTHKNLYQFAGKSLIQRQLELWGGQGFTDQVLIVNPEIESELAAEAKKMTNLDVKVAAQVGDGQAGAVETALGIIGTDYSGGVLVINANDVYEEALVSEFSARAYELAVKGHNLLTGYQVDDYFPGGYLELDSNGFVNNVIEKPGAGNEPSDVVKLVVDFFASAGELRDALKGAQSSSDDVYEVALASMMNSGKKFELLRYKGEWKTIKYPWHVLGVMDFYLNQIEEQEIHSSVKIPDSATIGGNVVIESGVKIFPGAVISGPAYIGPGAVIGNNALVRESIIGGGSVVGMNSEVARSYLGKNIWLHMNYLGDSILERNIALGSGAVTANFRLDEAEINVMVKGDKVPTNLTKLGAIIGADVRIGVGAKLMPGVKIGSNSVVGPGVIASEDIADSKFVKLAQQLNISDNKVDISKFDRSKIKQKL